MSQSLPYQLFPEITPYHHDWLTVGATHRMYFEQCGNPNGAPVVFLHGGPGSGCNPTQRRFFDPARYRIILLDQRGCVLRGAASWSTGQTVSGSSHAAFPTP